ncbi:hypothetical protein WG906_06250 [Pedobacter sp. P351]|uniref:hypothetical protein n=1 Tax=Pedobacter superstes TaxID=3133441 RepID=UPI0030A742A7
MEANLNKTIYKVGFWSGIIAFTATVAFFIVQILQVLGVLKYPWDEISIYGFSLCIPIPFLLEVLALHHITPFEKKYWSHAALLSTVIYVVFVTANYVVQLATVIPMTLKGKAEEIGILIQTPHSLFWNFDAIGYIFMGLATLFAVPVFEKEGFQKWVRYIFFAHGLVTPLIAFVYFYPNFSDILLLIGLPWGFTAPASMLVLALMFKKNFEIEKHKK